MYLLHLKYVPNLNTKSQRKPYSNGKIEFILQTYVGAQNEIQCV